MNREGDGGKNRMQWGRGSLEVVNMAEGVKCPTLAVSALILTSVLAEVQVTLSWFFHLFVSSYLCITWNWNDYLMTLIVLFNIDWAN